jgi:hypothetical protein
MFSKDIRCGAGAPLGRDVGLPGSGGAAASGALSGTRSARSAFRTEKHSPIMISTNGAADAMATDCRAVMAASTEPWIAPASRQSPPPR